jgi:hypothetical protein
LSTVSHKPLGTRRPLVYRQAFLKIFSAETHRPGRRGSTNTPPGGHQGKEKTEKSAVDHRRDSVVKVYKNDTTIL